MRRPVSFRREMAREQFNGWDMLGIMLGGAGATVAAWLIGEALF